MQHVEQGHNVSQCLLAIEAAGQLGNEDDEETEELCLTSKKDVELNKDVSTSPDLSSD